MIYESEAGKKVGKRKNKLDPIRDNLQPLVDRANLMVSQLRKNGYGDVPAMIDAMKTFRGEGDQLFSVSDKHRYRELRREAARIESFLSDASSLVSVASASEKAIDAVGRHNLSFWRQSENLERTGFRFGDVDEEKVKFALKIFRMVKEEPENALAFEKGSDRFNSDTLFNLIFDSIDEYNPNQPDEVKDEMIEFAKAEANRAIREQEVYEKGFLAGSPLVNKDTGIIEEVKKAKTTEEFFKENDWAMRYF